MMRKKTSDRTTTMSKKRKGMSRSSQPDYAGGAASVSRVGIALVSLVALEVGLAWHFCVALWPSPDVLLGHDAACLILS